MFNSIISLQQNNNVEKETEVSSLLKQVTENQPLTELEQG